jgi:hypothetical protein
MQQIRLEFIGCQHYGHHILYLASAAAEHVAAGWNDAQGQDLPAAVVRSSCVVPSSVQRVHPSSLVLPGFATPWPTNRLRAYRSDQQRQKNYRTSIIQQILIKQIQVSFTSQSWNYPDGYKLTWGYQKKMDYVRKLYIKTYQERSTQNINHNSNGFPREVVKLIDEKIAITS